MNKWDDVDWYGSKIRDFRQTCKKCGNPDFRLEKFNENRISFNLIAVCMKCKYRFSFSVLGQKWRGILKKVIKDKTRVRLVPKMGSTTMERLMIATEFHEPITVSVPCGYCPMAKKEEKKE